jgi:hypothetical protein
VKTRVRVVRGVHVREEFLTVASIITLSTLLDMAVDYELTQRIPFYYI